MSRPEDHPAEGRADSHVDEGAEELAGEVEAAKSLCLDLLARSPRSQAQLAAALARKEVPAVVAQEAIGRLRDVQLVDDRSFAADWAESRHRRKALGRHALAGELRQRGVSGDLIEEALAPIDRDSERAAARRVVAGRLSASAGKPYDVRIRRLVAMLARRGYDTSLALEVVREALAAEAEA